VAALLLLPSCTKEVVGVTGKVINEKYVSAEEGSFPMIVTMDGVWTAEVLEDWLSISEDCKGYIKGDYAVTVNYASNQSTESRRHFNRLGHVVIRSYDGFMADTVLVKQYGLRPYLELPEAVDVPAEALTYAIVLATNLTDEQRPNITCEASAAWVESVALNDAKTALDLVLAPYEGVERSAEVTFRFTDAWGEATEKTCTITQK
jgi:hypothetical protein